MGEDPGTTDQSCSVLDGHQHVHKKSHAFCSWWNLQEAANMLIVDIRYTLLSFIWHAMLICHVVSGVLLFIIHLFINIYTDTQSLFNNSLWVIHCNTLTWRNIDVLVGWRIYQSWNCTSDCSGLCINEVKGGPLPLTMAAGFCSYSSSRLKYTQLSKYVNMCFKLS